jgi:hypothetical protein
LVVGVGEVEGVEHFDGSFSVWTEDFFVAERVEGLEELVGSELLEELDAAVALVLEHELEEVEQVLVEV